MMNFFKSFLVFGFLFSSLAGVSQAQSADINLNIRDGSNIVFSGLVPMPGAGSVDISDSGGTNHSVNAQSVLSLVHSADIADGAWSLSDLTFYDSFGSFYVKCIDYSGGEKCDYWQYVVDGTSPFSSIDQSVLSGGEEVYLYFGNPHRVTLSASSVDVNQSFQVTAENYDYQNDTWEPLTGVTIGVTQPNPSDAFNPTEVLTQAVDGSGVATFSVATSGSYNVGIKEDYYFPTMPLSVNTASSGGGSGGGGGGSSSGGSSSSSGSSSKVELPLFDIIDAVKFLKEEMNEDGSVGSSELYTDWAAIAYGAGKVKDEPLEKIISYIATKTPSSYLTDNERRVIALLSLGQDPYSFGGVNYVDLILKDFDDKQFGEPDLVNDDIFAIIALYGAGYGIEDEIIKKDIEFILSEQKTNGSWEGSVDLTAAAVQALFPFGELEEVSKAIELSRKYLKTSQKDDGGWGSVYATSWVLQVEDILDQEWTQNKKSGENYLAVYQQGDGGVLSKKDKNDNRIWATSYAVPGVLGKSWIEIMQRVEKKENKLAMVLGAETQNTPVLGSAVLPKIQKVVTKTEITNEVKKDLEEVKDEPANIAPAVLGVENTAAVINSGSNPGVVFVAFAFGLGLGLGLGVLLRRVRTA